MSAREFKIEIDNGYTFEAFFWGDRDIEIIKDVQKMNIDRKKRLIEVINLITEFMKSQEINSLEITKL